MIIEPLRGVGPLDFGMTEEQIERLLGRPISVQRFNEHETASWDYGWSEISSMYFVNGKLSSLLIVTAAETILWGKVLHQIPTETLEELLISNEHEFVSIPSCHPLVRPQIISRTAGLCFTLRGGCCDDVEVLSLESAAAMTF
jgi:hypothetical protein